MHFGYEGLKIDEPLEEFTVHIRFEKDSLILIQGYGEVITLYREGSKTAKEKASQLNDASSILVGDWFKIVDNGIESWSFSKNGKLS